MDEEQVWLIAFHGVLSGGGSARAAFERADQIVEGHKERYGEEETSDEG